MAFDVSVSGSANVPCQQHRAAQGKKEEEKKSIDGYALITAGFRSVAR